MAEASRTEIMDVDLDSLWAEITDYESYPEFVEGCSDTHIIERKGNTAVVEYEINMMKKIRYQLEHKETPKKKLEWKMVDGDFFKSNSGSWNIKPLDDGKLEVTYTVKVEMPKLVPKKIVDMAVNSNLPDMLAAFEDRAYNRMKKAKKATKKKLKKKVAKK